MKFKAFVLSKTKKGVVYNESKTDRNNIKYSYQPGTDW